MKKKIDIFLFLLNLVQNGIVVSETIQFDFLNVHDFGPWSRNVLDLQYSHIFINSIRSLLVPTFRSLAKCNEQTGKKTCL